MKAVVLAYRDMGVAGLEALLRHGFDIAAVFTHTGDPGETPWGASVAEWAASRGIPVHAPPDINHPIWVERVRAMAPDVLFSFLYRRMIGRPLLDTPPAGCFNLHPSLLPAIRQGTAPWTPQDDAAATYFGGRRPEDGRIDWCRRARDVRNLVRAVARPYPGAFTRVCTSGAQLAAEMHLVPGTVLGPARRVATRESRKSVLILGVNGFIGNALGRRLLASGRYEVHGMDIRCDNIDGLLGQEGFRFREGDISIQSEWIDSRVRACDVVVPLVAVATLVEYMRDPLRVFELGFEQNLRIVRACARHGTRLVFPSTSEVYGMCGDDAFDEDASPLVTGPIDRQRWIYASSKQLLDRVIWAYGAQHGLPFTLFRPFNWIGPRLDSLDAARIGSSRVVTQMILAIVEGEPIQLVDGGRQRRCFTDIDDGVECLYGIIDNAGGRCDGRIINIGSPDNELSIRALAVMLAELFERHPLRDRFPPFAGFRDVEAEVFYGPGYQDIVRRRPSIRNARHLLAWTPRTGVEDAVSRTLDFFLRDVLTRRGAGRGVEIEITRRAGTPAPTP